MKETKKQRNKERKMSNKMNLNRLEMCIYPGLSPMFRESCSFGHIRQIQNFLLFLYLV